MYFLDITELLGEYRINNEFYNNIEVLASKYFRNNQYPFQISSGTRINPLV